MGSGAKYHPLSYATEAKQSNVRKDATICERQEIRGQAGVPSRDGAGSSTVRLAVGETKREKFAVKGRTRRQRLTRTLRSRLLTKRSESLLESFLPHCQSVGGGTIFVKEEGVGAKCAEKQQTNKTKK